jgi:fructose-bisphosphate aldolase class I
MNTTDMTAKMASGNGFIAALDQSGGSTPKALAGYGVTEDAWTTEEEMFGLIHEMRARIIRSEAFSGEKVIGAILFERTMDGTVDGKGLENEANGVQLMKPMPTLDTLLSRSKALGVYGTKERSVINSANREGIAAVVAQQFEVGKQVLSHGMMPIIEPEVNIKSETRAECDTILLDEILKNLDALPEGTQVMLKLSLPIVPCTFDPLVSHPKVLRVVALSGGYKRPEACVELAKNTGIIASFSHQMTDAEFDASLAAAIDEIYTGSTQKTLVAA